ncbi:MAG: DUF3883 domain-containing protein, partial [Boseongicola sp.]|nr:DUF3883 domain-containing protein [Boseongicola sp.]
DGNVPDSAPNALSRAEIEAMAMEAVMAHERSLGNDPSDVSSEDRGYDIESRHSETGRLRFIEVKGRRADARAITVTRNEILSALNTGQSFILAAVLVEDGRPQRPLYVPDPAHLFGSEPGFNEVHRAITIDSI